MTVARERAIAHDADAPASRWRAFHGVAPHMTSRSPLAIVAALVALFLLQTASQPACAQANLVRIFFDKQISEPSPLAKKTVEVIKGMLKRSSLVTITGHSDTSEADPEKLSLARAVAVLNALVALGVPQGVAITVIGRGTAEPLHKTGPNVGEPRNRHVSVTINK
jgi:outer membrane protein OmpA-like peptidoglycan-associated protein